MSVSLQSRYPCCHGRAAAPTTNEGLTAGSGIFLVDQSEEPPFPTPASSPLAGQRGTARSCLLPPDLSVRKQPMTKKQGLVARHKTRYEGKYRGGKAEDGRNGLGARGL